MAGDATTGAPSATCHECESPVQVKATGRQRAYCSRACQAKAYRSRKSRERAAAAASSAAEPTPRPVTAPLLTASPEVPGALPPVPPRVERPAEVTRALV